ncbi:MAG TPA: hypothetical protein VF049_22270 [Nocardioidaceae bacterium]
MTDDLAAEEWPTGTFGGPRTPTPQWTPAEQATHREQLEAALKEQP